MRAVGAMDPGPLAGWVGWTGEAGSVVPVPRSRRVHAHDVWIPQRGREERGPRAEGQFEGHAGAPSLNRTAFPVSNRALRSSTAPTAGATRKGLIHRASASARGTAFR